MLIKKMLKVLLIGVIVNGINLSAGIVNNDDTTIKLIGVDKLPHDEESGYCIEVNKAAVGKCFPGGIRYYHARGGFTNVNNGVVTLEVMHYNCDIGVAIIKLTKVNDPNYKKIIARKKIPCGRTTVIRIR